MLTLDVKFESAGAVAMLKRVSTSLSRRTELHGAMAVAVEERVRGHLLELNSRSPNTGYYAKASRSVESEAGEDDGTVRVVHRGAALRYYGGRVSWDGKVHLALPTAAVPIRGDERLRPRKIKNLAYLPAGKAAKPGTTGYLVEGEPVTTAGGKTRIKPLPNGQLMYVLREFTDHKKDETVLPPYASMLAAAKEAGENYLAAAADEGGAA